MTENQHFDAISDAITRFIKTGLPPQVSDSIATEFGFEIAAKVRSVYEAAMKALGVLAQYVQNLFPWLTGPARTGLNYCYIRTWK